MLVVFNKQTTQATYIVADRVHMANSIQTQWDTCPIALNLNGTVTSKDAIQRATCARLFADDDGLYKLDAHADKTDKCTKTNADIVAKPTCYKLTSTDFKLPVSSDGTIEKNVTIASSDQCPDDTAMPVFTKVERSAKSCFDASLDTLTDALKLDVDKCSSLSKVPKCKQKSEYVLEMPGTFEVTDFSSSSSSNAKVEKYWDALKCQNNGTWLNNNGCGFENVDSNQPNTIGAIYKLNGSFSNAEFHNKCVKIKGKCNYDEMDNDAGALKGRACMSQLFNGDTSSIQNTKVRDSFAELVTCPAGAVN